MKLYTLKFGTNEQNVRIRTDYKGVTKLVLKGKWPVLAWAVECIGDSVNDETMVFHDTNPTNIGTSELKKLMVETSAWLLRMGSRMWSFPWLIKVPSPILKRMH